MVGMAKPGGTYLYQHLVGFGVAYLYFFNRKFTVAFSYSGFAGDHI
jgi:hypothetical protein